MQQIIYRELPGFGPGASIPLPVAPNAEHVASVCNLMQQWAAENGARIISITAVEGTRFTSRIDAEHWRPQTVGLICVCEKA